MEVVISKTAIPLHVHLSGLLVSFCPQAYANRRHTMIEFAAETFTLLAIGVIITALRVAGRIHVAGWAGIRGDDHFAIVGLVSY